VPEPAPVRCAIYCRISLARHGETLKVDDQAKLCLKVARQRGWKTSAEQTYKDNSKSAWRRDRKRPGWDAMLDAITTGTVGAIVVYHGDRLIRQPWDLEVLLRLADERGIHLASPTGTRNLDNPDDRFILRIEAAQACRESDNTSRRLKWHYEKQAQKGFVRLGGRGGRAFGFEPDGLTVREADADAIREMADRLLTGEPIGAIARDLNDRGIVTATGGPWDHGALKKLMLRPRLAGLVSHNGRIVGPAAWPAILDRETWETVVAVLEQKAAGFDYATNARRYLLTGIARCGPCGQPLSIRHNTRSESLRGYGCINPACTSKVHRSVRHLDPYVESAAVAMLNNAKLRARMQPVTRDTAPLVAELTRASQRRDQVIAEFGDDDEMGADVLRLSVRRIDKRIAQLRTDIASARAPSVLDGLWGISLDGWKALGLHRQRAAVQALMRVTVWPSGRRGPGFDPATVKLEQN
jgi:site-specific DNA recombinase